MIDGIVAVVNDAVITRQQVQDIATNRRLTRCAANTRLISVEFQQKINDALTNQPRTAHRAPIDFALFRHTAGYRLPDSAVDDLVQERVRERFGNRVTLMKTLQAEGMTFEQFREDVRNQYIESALRNKNVSQEIVVSPYQIERLFQRASG